MNNRQQLVTIVLLMSLTAPLSAQTQLVNGNTYSETVEIGGQTLILVGSGLRKRLFLDVYTMGAYTESRICDPQMLISLDETKYLRIDLLRDVDAKSMVQTLEDALEKNLPTAARSSLQSQVDTFVSYFEKDLEKGDRMELIYAPGVGTVLMQNRQQQGVTMPGKGFADVLWSSYFSSATCCSRLKNQILVQCSR